MSMSPVYVFIAAAFCVATCASRSAPAAEASAVASAPGRDPIEFTYQFDSADLMTTRGTRRVYRNLILQAQRACSDDGASMIDLYRMDRRCASALVDGVVLKIGSPVLAALHARSPAAHGFAATSRDRDFVGSL